MSGKNSSLTIREFGQRFSGADNEYFLRTALKVDAAALLINPQKKIPAAALKKIYAWQKLRAEKNPMQYILHRAWFYGREFFVDGRVLIPRPESELMIEHARQNMAPIIIDVGAGSGCLAITLKKLFPAAIVHATDVSAAALTVAKKNARTHRTPILFHHKNLLKNFVWPRTPKVLIVANLPYLPKNFKRNLSPEVKKEPALALFSGVDGLDLYRQLFSQIAAQKNPQQTIVLLCEIEPTQKNKIVVLTKKIFPAAKISFFTDSHQQTRLAEIKI